MSATTRHPGFFRVALKALITSRQRSAERYVNGFLLSLDDETLKSYGYSREELSKNGASGVHWL